MNRKISVIVPVYNAENYLSRCIDSILRQTFSLFELILINDGSIDSSPEILDEYAKKDNRIIVIHKENGGHASARNAGIDSACCSETKWITFIDSDDWVDEHYLEYLLNAVEEYKTLISICGYERVHSIKDNFQEVMYNPTIYNPEDFWCNKRINATIPCGKLYAKEFFINGTRWPNKVHDDEHMTYKLLFECNKVVFLNENLYKYYYNEDSVMVSTWTPKRIDSVYAIKERREYFKDNNFQQALTLDNKLYLEEIYNTLCNFINIKNKYKKEYKFLKKELQRELRKNGNALGYNKKEANYMWMLAFPKLKLIYYCKRFVRIFVKRDSNV